MTLKKLFKFTLLLCFLFSASRSPAQEDEPAFVRARSETNWMQQNLDLTIEQNQMAYSINFVNAQADENIMKNGDDIANELYKARMKKILGLEKLFTPEQFEKFKQHEGLGDIEQMKKRIKP
jgi:hypothetical protein